MLFRFLQIFLTFSSALPADRAILHSFFFLSPVWDLSVMLVTVDGGGLIIAEEKISTEG